VLPPREKAPPHKPGPAPQPGAGTGEEGSVPRLPCPMLLEGPGATHLLKSQQCNNNQQIITISSSK